MTQRSKLLGLFLAFAAGGCVYARKLPPGVVPFATATMLFES